MSNTAHAGHELGRLAQGIAEEAVRRIYTARGLTWERFGAGGMAKSIRDMGYHIDALRDALLANEPALFDAYVDWCMVLFDGLGFDATTMVYTLQALDQVITEHMGTDASAPARAILAQGLAAAAQPVAPPPPFVHQEKPLGELAQQYLQALLLADRQAALEMVGQAVDEGAPVRDVYLHVFQPVQHEVGRLWQTNQITVAQEHFCTAATQLVMSHLYPHIFASERCGHRMVATCVGGELHEIGVRMVADFFEMAGWDTYYLGANMPASSVISALEANDAEILAVSATMSRHVQDVAELIHATRASRSGHDVRILVGGYPFNLSETLWQTVDADGSAHNADAAIALAGQWVA